MDLLNVVEKSMIKNKLVQMIYQSDKGRMTKRRIKVLKVNGNQFQAYCFLRKSKRTFKMNNILALVPIEQKESMVV